jgi:hypothetical protein
MEIYSSAKSKATSDKPHEFYYSRTRLIAGAIIWSMGSAFFLVLTAMAIPKTGAGYLVGLIALASVWMLINCIRGLGKLHTPALVIGRDGVLFPDGQLIDWDDMEENTYLNQTYMGLIPIGRYVVIKTRLKKPKTKKLRVFALDMTSDEYLALCDRYSGGAFADR